MIEETVQINDQCSSQLESMVKCINMFIMTESSQCSAFEALQIESLEGFRCCYKTAL